MKKESIKTTKLFWVGLLIFTSMFLFFYGIKFLQDESLQKSTFSFKIIFKNAQGIDSGDEVRMLGKKIGYIRGTSIIGQNIVIDVYINNVFNTSIPIDSKFEITSEDIMGAKFLRIYPGKDTKKFIIEGDTVSGLNAGVVSLTQDISDFAKTLNQTFGLDQKNQIIEAVASINKFTKDLESFMENNKDLITDEDRENIHRILFNFNSVTEKFETILAEQSSNIQVAIENISQFATKLPEMSSQISSLSEKIEIIINNINNGEGTLAKMITDDSIYNNANTLLENTNNLILDAKSFTSDVQKNPKKYIKAYFAAKREESKK